MVRKPPIRLLGQTMLVFIPVIALAITGFLSLRRDRLAVRHEAEERARELAQGIADQLWRQLEPPGGRAGEPSTDPSTIEFRPSTAPSTIEFRISTNGALVFPPPIPALAPAQLDYSRLTPAQVELWETARTHEFARRDPTAAANAYLQFLASNPPQP